MWGWALVMLCCAATDAAAWVDATSQVTVARGTFTIAGQSGSAIHTHGGPPAQLGHVRVSLENRGDRPRTLSIQDVEFLQTSKDCEHPPTRVVSHPKPAGILLEDGLQKHSTPQVRIAPGPPVMALVGFAHVPAYYVYCDRFAFRVHFRVDGEPAAVVVEVNITREEALRPRHGRPPSTLRPPPQAPTPARNRCAHAPTLSTARRWHRHCCSSCDSPQEIGTWHANTSSSSGPALPATRPRSN